MSSADSSVEIEGDIRGACGVSISSGLDNKTVDNLEILQSLSPSSDLSMSSDVSTEEESPTSENQFDNVEQIDQRHINEDETDKIDACNKKSQKNLSARKTDPVVESSVGSLTPDGHGKKTGTRRGTETFLEENLELSTPDDNGLLTGRKPTSKCKLFKKSKGFLRKKRRSPRAVFYKVFATRARNISFGGHQIIQSSEQDVREVEKTSCTEPTRPRRNSRVKRLLESTERDIEWTSNMVKTSCVSEIVKKIGNHVNWITITGNAGDGKTTTGYLVLEEMVKRGKEVFHVKETDQYYIVTENTKNSVIMLNDVLGAFTFDHTAMSKWEPVLHDALDNITKSKDSGNFDSVTVIFISRWNVLQGGKNMFGKFDILEPSNLFNLSNTHETVGDERLQILEYHLKGAGVTDVTAREKTCVASCITPHGFPHCCKIYADLRKTLNKINISDFFLCPLQFLDKTTKVLTEKYEHEKLFKLLIENDGKMDVNSIKDENLRQQICSSVSSLIGSYLTNNNGIIKFTHPSIYESVAYCIGRKDEAFAIEKFSFSFLMQKMKFTHKPTQEHGEMSSDSLFIQPTESNIDRLSDRFHLPILYRNFEVLHHPFFSSERFCEKVISSVTMHRRRCLFGCVCSQIKVDKIDTDAQDTEGNTLLLKSVQSRYLTAARVLIKHGADVNRADKKGRTPLHLLCWNKEADGETLKLMIKHVDDVNKADKKGCTPLHLLCYHKAVDAKTLELMIKHGVDVNKADKYGFTPLHWLCSNEAVDGETLEMMIKHGADVNKADANGCIPFHYLCEKVKVDTDIVRLMIKHGADVNKADAFGDNSLIPLV